MIGGRSVLVVVPARGGSKGIKLKNLVKLKGKTLVSLVGEVVDQLDFVDKAIVSTDHPEIAEVAKTSGFEVPFMRPDELSGDIISDVEVLTHALIEMEKLDKKIYDIIVMLQPTCPLRKAQHVVQTVNMLLDSDFDAVWTISKSDSKNHPLKQLKICDNRIEYYDPRGKEIIAKQQLTTLYHRNGSAYAITRDCINIKNSIKGDNAGYILLNEPMISIDTMEDVLFAEYVISREKK